MKCTGHISYAVCTDAFFHQPLENSRSCHLDNPTSNDYGSFYLLSPLSINVNCQTCNYLHKNWLKLTDYNWTENTRRVDIYSMALKFNGGKMTTTTNQTTTKKQQNGKKIRKKWAKQFSYILKVVHTLNMSYDKLPEWKKNCQIIVWSGRCCVHLLDDCLLFVVAASIIIS